MKDLITHADMNMLKFTVAQDDTKKNSVELGVLCGEFKSIKW